MNGLEVSRGRTTRAALALGWQAAPLESTLGLAVTVAMGLVPAAAAWTGKMLFDELARGQAMAVDRATWLVAVGALLAGTLVVLTQLSGQLARRAQRAVALRAQDVLYRSVNAFPGIGNFEDPAFQDRLRLAEQGAQSAPRDINILLTETARNGVVIVGFLGTLLAVWPPMAAVLLVTAVPTAVAQRALAERRARMTAETMESQRRRFFFQQLLTDATMAKEVRLYGLGDLFHGRLLAAAREAADADLKVEGHGSRVQSALALFGAGVAAAGTVVVVRGVAAGHVSLGDLTLFTAAVAGVQGSLSSIIGQAAQAGRTLRLFRSFLEVVYAAAAVDGGGRGRDGRDRDGGRAMPALRSGIVFEDVWFRYHDRAPWALRGVSVTIPTGRSVGLVGLNGAGKSTLVKLLCRFYEPDRGRILWDGVDIRELSLPELRRRIGATFQDFCRYDVTAAENIGVGDVARLTDLPAIRRAAAAAGIDETLAGLRDGYGTLLSRIFLDGDRERGLALSGGQWQRVAVARALLRTEADLLILDEPSSGLDAEAEYEIHQALTAHRETRTTLLISHRLSTLRTADLIVVLHEGRITEQGTHDQLLGTDSQYARLFTLQASGYRDTPEPKSTVGSSA